MAYIDNICAYVLLWESDVLIHLISNNNTWDHVSHGKNFLQIPNVDLLHFGGEPHGMTIPHHPEEIKDTSRWVLPEGANYPQWCHVIPARWLVVYPLRASEKAMAVHRVSTLGVAGEIAGVEVKVKDFMPQMVFSYTVLFVQVQCQQFTILCSNSTSAVIESSWIIH